MKHLWKRKWLLMALTLAIFLSVGAVAWAAGNGGSPAVSDEQQILTAAVRSERPTREALKEKREQWIERHKALMELVREEMTPEDQAAYDQLVQTAKEQREALAQAREALKATLVDLRELTDKYLSREQAAGSTAATTDN